MATAPHVVSFRVCTSDFAIDTAAHPAPARAAPRRPERAHRVRVRTALQCTYGTPHTRHATAAQNDKSKPLDKTLCGGVSEEEVHRCMENYCLFINVDIRMYAARKRLPSHSITKAFEALEL